MRTKRFLFNGVYKMLLIGAAAMLCAPAIAKEDKWLRVGTREFTLITSLSEKEAVVWAGEFSQYIGELRNLFNTEQPLAPLTIVIFAQDRTFADYRPLGENGKPQEVAGFFQRHPSWAVVGLAGASASEAVRRTIFHEGVHWFLSAFDQPNPVWIEEGLAEVFSTFMVTKNKAEWGRAIPEHVTLLRQEKLMPMDQLLYVGQRGLFRDDSHHTGIVYAQSWAAVHFLLYGQSKEIPRLALFDFLRLTNKGMSIESAFREAVGCDYATFDRYLNAYLQKGSYYVRSRSLMARAPLKAQPAPPVEVSRALGKLALAARRGEKAVAFARNAIALVPNDPRGYELLGMALKQSGDVAGGLAAFAIAEEKGSTDFQPYFELALAAQQAATNEAGETTGLATAEARRIAERYQRAIMLSPRFLPSYQNLAGMMSLVEPMPQDRQYLELGLKNFPTDGLIQMGLAVLTDRGGDRASARKVLEQLQEDPNQPGRVRTQARTIADGWAQQEIIARINALAKEKKISEALTYLEEQLSTATNFRFRTQLSSMRPQLRSAVRSQEIRQAFSEKRWDDARRLLTETIESPETPVHLRAQSQRSLDDLNRREAARKQAKPSTP